MSHLINPLLVDGYIDDEPHKSVQGCFVGSDYWEAERKADIAIGVRRALYAEINWLKSSIERLKEELEEAEKRNLVRRPQWLRKHIAKLEAELKENESYLTKV